MLASDTQSLQRTAVLFAHLVAPCKGLQSRCFNEKHKETSSMQQQRLSEINTWCTSDFQSFQELKALVETIHFIVSMRASSFLLQFEFWRLVKHVLIYSKMFCMVSQKYCLFIRWKRSENVPANWGKYAQTISVYNIFKDWEKVITQKNTVFVTQWIAATFSSIFLGIALKHLVSLNCEWLW